jgi:hypothetical protein
MDMYHVHTQMREVAIAIDEARHQAPMSKGGMNYELALCAVRGCRTAIDEKPERATVVKYLYSLVDALCIFRGSVVAIDPAIEMVERLIEDLEPQAA